MRLSIRFNAYKIKHYLEVYNEKNETEKNCIKNFIKFLNNLKYDKIGSVKGEINSQAKEFKTSNVHETTPPTLIDVQLLKTCSKCRATKVWTKYNDGRIEKVIHRTIQTCRHKWAANEPQFN